GGADGDRGVLRLAFARDDRPLPRPRARARSRAHGRQRVPRSWRAWRRSRRRVRAAGDDRAFGITPAARLGITFGPREERGSRGVAGALRPVVLLMLLASLLFVVDGFFDGVYPGGPAWFTGKYDNLAEIAYLFAIVNTVVAVMVARGSERSLQSRIGLSVFFLIERPITAFALGPKPVESIITHFATAAVELLILITALRVWRLGNAAPDVDMLFSLEGSSPIARADQDTEALRRTRSAVGTRNAWLIGGVTLALAVALVVDG